MQRCRPQSPSAALEQKRTEVSPLFDCRNAEQSKCLWKLSDISEKSDNEGKLVSPHVVVIGTARSKLCLAPGAGTLRAKFELSNGPSNPSTLAVQFLNEGTTLSGVDMELQGSGYRLSLTKKRFATGTLGSSGRAGINKAPAFSDSSALFLRAIHGRLLRPSTTMPLKNKHAN